MLITGKVSAPSPGGKRTQLRTSLSLFLSARGEAEMSKEDGQECAALGAVRASRRAPAVPGRSSA
jgi:hypothetical protein